MKWQIYKENSFIKSEYIDIIREIYIDQPYFRLLLILQNEFLLNDKYLAQKLHLSNANDQARQFKYSSVFTITSYREIMRKHFPNINIYNPIFEILNIVYLNENIDLLDCEYRALIGNSNFT